MRKNISSLKNVKPYMMLIECMLILTLALAMVNFSFVTVYADETSWAETQKDGFTPYRDVLSEKEQQVYDQVCENIESYNTKQFQLAQRLSEEELDRVMNAVYNDMPEFFFINTSYRYLTTKSGICTALSINYAIPKSEFQDATAKYNQVIDSIVSEANKLETTLQKERYIYSAIADLNTYDMNSAHNQSAYAALVHGRSVCAGYARAFQVICNRVGIPCYYVTGQSRDQLHAWNIVDIDGNLYSVDLTWDDGTGERTGTTSYKYFNQQGGDFDEDHELGILSQDMLDNL